MSPLSSSSQQDWQQRSLRAVWHPCTQMARAAARVPPLPIARGEGAWLYDFEGRRYFDANSSWWVNLFGHADAGLNAAIKQQLDTLPHVMLAGCTHAPAVRLAERLSALTDGALGHCFFASDGASAVEIALKQSFHSWRNRGRGQKREFVCLKNGYHGETIGALAVTDVQIFRDAYDPLLMRAHIVEAPDERLGNEPAALAAMRELLARRHAQIAAVIIEPLIQGAAGMVMHAPSYLQALRALCSEFEVHLIADEIAVGCGRSGTFFAWAQAQAPFPDFLLLSKGITGGTLPLSLVLSTEAVFQAFWSEEEVARGFLHSHSYTGNALACAAANAVLDRFEHEGQLAKNREQAALLALAFEPLRHDERIAHLRQRGMVLAFDVRQSGERFAERFHLAARRHQLLIRPIGSTVYLMPPYLIDLAAAQFLFKAVLATLDEVQKAMLLDHLQRKLAAIAAQDLTRFLRAAESPTAPRQQVRGADGLARELLMFCANDYLGLAAHPCLSQALAEGAQIYGGGSGASHLISGHSVAHERLEAELAAWYVPHIPQARALSFCTGYMANLAVLTALGDGEAEIFSEALNHASLIDGARLARAQLSRYGHCDLAQLRAQLQASQAKVKLIVTDAVFSMDGDIAPLPELLALAEEFNAWLIVDDAHGFGVLGQRGRGALEHFELCSERLVLIGTLGKAAGLSGAFVVAHDTIVEYLLQAARSYIFTTASLPAVAHALLSSLDLIAGDTGTQRRQRLRQLQAQLRSGVAALLARHPRLSWRLAASSTPVQPLIVGGNAEVMALAARLERSGIRVPGIRPPTVPKGEARLRITLCATHEAADVDRLLAQLEEAAA